MRALIFGDSITQGYFDTEGGWVARLRKEYDQIAVNTASYDPLTIFNLGISGDCSDDLSARFESETKSRVAEDLIFVFAVGVNDTKTNSNVNYSDISKYIQNIKSILESAKVYSDKILFVGLTPCVDGFTNPVAWDDTCYTNKRIEEFDSALRDFCDQQEVEFVEVFEPFTRVMQQDELMPDGLHPNNAGHQLLLNLIKPHVEKLVN